MNVLLVHPSPLMYSEIYLRLEPLCLERVGQALRSAGHVARRHRPFLQPTHGYLGDPGLG
jgi:hypothetical protein